MYLQYIDIYEIFVIHIVIRSLKLKVKLV